MQFPFISWGTCMGAFGAIYMYVWERAGASELRNFLHFHILKVLFPSIFCWYFRYFVSETYIFRSPNTIVYTIIWCSSLLLSVVWGLCKQQYTDKTLTLNNIYLCERVERASLKNFRIFTLYNCYFLQYFVGTSDTLSQEHNIFTFFRSQNTFAYIHTVNAVPCYYLWYGAICKRQYTDKTLTLRKFMYSMRASLENFHIFTF